MQIMDENPEAESIHRLVADLANGDATMLLTSREQPAGLRNELLYPERNHALRGLGDEAGVSLFFQHSVKAKENPEEHMKFALDIQHAADGHPLAIALLAGEYDVRTVSMDIFLQYWEEELANARRSGLAGHHVTFSTAFERSYSHLSAEMQTRLALLSVFPFPFFAIGAALVWGDGEEDVETANQTLDEFARRSLLEVDGWYKDDTPATYRFQPALRQEAAHRLDSTLKANQQNGYAEYGKWFEDMAFDEIGKQPPIVRLALTSLGELINIADYLPDDKTTHYCWQLGTILYQLGFTREADAIHKKGATIALAQGDDVRRERILFQQARMNILRGNLAAALVDLDECARLEKSRITKVSTLLFSMNKQKFMRHAATSTAP